MDNPIDEVQIMRRIAERDSKALEWLYDRYEQAVYSFAYRFVGDAMLAEEIVQELFMRIWNHAKPFDPSQGKLSTWIFAITRNIAIDQLRRKQNRTAKQTEDTELFAAIPDERMNPEEEASKNLMAEIVKDAVKELNEEQRNVLDWIYFQGLTHQEISAGKGIPLGTVKSRLRLALKQLRTRLGGSERRETPHDIHR
ncbi:RNA polymerase sigma factor [Paenibacillus aurantiacus]|uniref:RNA polymerase sigma factor n=1 Tax=Paenibacillus aurantiacus TaxID=1936118 RepID=A0ABV5KW45_9BACL